MYFDPNWIFDEKPPKNDYPNITGLMPVVDKPKKKKPVINSLADVFSMEPIRATGVPIPNQMPDQLTPKPVNMNMSPARRQARMFASLSPEEKAQVMENDKQIRAAEQQRQDNLSLADIDLEQKTRQLTAWGNLDPLIKDSESGNYKYLTDRRTVNPITGEPLNPNTDLKSGKYDMDVLELLALKAQKAGIDPLIPISMAIQESLAGNLDANIGHTINMNGADNPYDAMINKLVDLKTTYPQILKDSRGITEIPKGQEDLYWLQGYNGYGMLTPDTEKEYHGGASSSFYGVPVTKEQPLDMAKTQAYAKWIMSLRDNYANDSDIKEMLQRIQNQ